MTTLDIADLPHAEKPSFAPFGWAKTIVSRWRHALLHRRTIDELSRLDPHLLRDIGVPWTDVGEGLTRRRMIWLDPPDRK